MIVAILFVSAIAETISYYNGIVNDRNSKIANLNNEIANLTSQISNLTAQLTNLTSANLVTALGITDVHFSSFNMPPTIYNRLYIAGSVTDEGEGRAYNSGLHVIAYDARGTLEINMTVPLSGSAVFGTDSATNAFVLKSYGNSSLQLGSLGSWETSTIAINIFHEGTVTNWTITPVWTNSQ